MKLKFPPDFRHITLADLNSQYGDKGKTFDSYDEARYYQDNLPGGGYLVRLVNYRHEQIELIREPNNKTGKLCTVRAIPKPKAKPYTLGFLVTPKPVKKKSYRKITRIIKHEE